MKSKFVALFLILLLSLFQANNAIAQNYWGDGSIQDVNASPNPEIVNPEEKKVTDLPEVDVPDEDAPSLKPKINLGENDKQIEPSNKASLIELGIKSEKLPVGTKLAIVLNTNLNAKKTKIGTPFSATIDTDVTVDGDIVIPAGSLIRGRIGKVKKAGMFSKSGSMLLSFDHIVTPLGKQITLDVDLSKANNINKKGELIASKGFVGEIKDSAKAGYNTAKTATKTGYDLGMAAGKVPVVVTVPVGATLGGIAGTTVFATKSAIAVFKKGGNPIINSGDKLEINFTEDLDIPVN